MLHFISTFISQMPWPLINTQNKCDNIHLYFNCWLPQTRTIYPLPLNCLVELDLACALHALNVSLKALYPKLEFCCYCTSPSVAKGGKMYPRLRLSISHQFPMPFILSTDSSLLAWVSFLSLILPRHCSCHTKDNGGKVSSWMGASGRLEFGTRGIQPGG